MFTPIGRNPAPFVSERPRRLKRNRHAGGAEFALKMFFLTIAVIFSLFLTNFKDAKQ